jgi:hypothetical protein
MIGRLLIDECLSPELAQLAIEAGHVESTSVRDRGRLGLKDWELMEYVIQEDFMPGDVFFGLAMGTPGGVEFTPLEGRVYLSGDYGFRV